MQREPNTTKKNLPRLSWPLHLWTIFMHPPVRLYVPRTNLAFSMWTVLEFWTLRFTIR
jgi:hypothetical protein